MLKKIITRIQSIFLIQIVLIGVLYTTNCHASIQRKKTHNFYFSITDIRDSSKAIELKEKFMSKYSFKEYEPASDNNKNNINLYKSDITRIQAFHLRISLALKGIFTKKYKIRDVKYKTAIGRKRFNKVSAKKRKENQRLHIY